MGVCIQHTKSDYLRSDDFFVFAAGERVAHELQVPQNASRRLEATRHNATQHMKSLQQANGGVTTKNAIMLGMAEKKQMRRKPD